MHPRILPAREKALTSTNCCRMVTTTTAFSNAVQFFMCPYIHCLQSRWTRVVRTTAHSLTHHLPSFQNHITTKLTLLISPSSPHPYIYYKTYSHARARSHQLHARRGARTPHLGRHWSNHRETNSPSFARHHVTPRYLSAMAIACNPVARRAHIGLVFRISS